MENVSDFLSRPVSNIWIYHTDPQVSGLNLAQEAYRSGPTRNQPKIYSPIQEILILAHSSVGDLKALGNGFCIMWQYYDCHGEPL